VPLLLLTVGVFLLLPRFDQLHSIIKHDRQISARLAQFAAVNHLVKTSDHGSDLPFRLISASHSTLYDIIDVHGTEVGRFKAIAIDNEGNETYTISNHFYARVKLNSSAPHLLFDSKAMPIKRSEVYGKTIPLEGDFNKYFNVHTPDNYHRDALQFLTPDIMQAMIDYGRDYDFELIGHHLYLYTKIPLRRLAADYERFIKNGAYFGHRFNRKTAAYRDERLPSATVRLADRSEKRHAKWSFALLAAIDAILICMMFAAHADGTLLPILPTCLAILNIITIAPLIYLLTK
jgi:hypothetical protein